MYKKLISLLLISSFIFMGCSKKDTPVTDTESNLNSTFNYTSNNITNNQLALTDQTSSFSPYSTLGSLLIFPDKANNNRLSTASLPLTDGFIKDNSIKDIFNYSIESSALINNSIYFTNISDNNSVYKLDYEKNEITKVGAFSAYNLTANRNSLYFIDVHNNKRLMSYDVDKDKLNSICNDKVGTFIVNGENILYQNLSDGASLYSIRTDGSSRTKLTDFSVNSFIPYEGNILVINSDDNNALYKIDTITNKSKRITSLNGSDIKIFDNKIYYLNNAAPYSLHSLSVNLTNDTFSTSDPLIDNVNEYYTTQSGIFLELSNNVNSTYKLSTK